MSITQSSPDSEIVRLINVLRADEGDSVEILCDNPDFNGQPNCAIVCCGDWTGWLHKRFAADTLLDALSMAMVEKNLPSPRKVIATSNGHHWIERFNLVCCRDCGFVRRADDQNAPCKGVVGVGIRRDLLPPSSSSAGMTIDDVPSCGQENDYRRAQSSAGIESAEVQDTYLVGGPDLKAMSGSVESDRVIQLHFRRKATYADRKWLLEAINAKIAADKAGVGDVAQPSAGTSEPVAYRWRQPGNKHWIYDPTPEWIEDHKHEIELEPLFNGVAQAERDKADYKIGWWLSAALEDPAVSAEMKADINAWFEAHQPGLKLPSTNCGGGK